MSSFVQVYKIGRCTSGAERDSGNIVHLRFPDQWVALCGSQPGRRSAGWSDPLRGELPKWTRQCLRCFKKAEVA